MKSIQENPYRVAGLLSNAAEKELIKQKTKIKRYNEVGRNVTSEYDFSFLKPIRRDKSKIENAFSNIERDQNKINHALFWFINANPIDHTAIQHLVNGNKKKAIEIWEKVINHQAVSTRNFSAYNNLGTLYLTENIPEKLKQGITSKIKLLESDNFKDFAHTVADETFTVNNKKQIQIFIDEVLGDLKKEYSTEEMLNLFSNCNGIAQKYISKKLTGEPIHLIEAQIDRTKNKRKENKIKAYNLGVDLYKNTENNLTLLNSLLGSTDLQYRLLMDNVAKEILQCSIDYFNESQRQKSNRDYLDESMKLTKLAQYVAVNPITIDKIKENIHILKRIMDREMKDRELNQAIDMLRSLKVTYEEIYENLVEQAEEDMILNRHNPSLLVSINSEKTSIDYDLLRRLARRYIIKIAFENYLSNYISDEKLLKIAKSNQEEKIEEFYELLKVVNNDIIDIKLHLKEKLLFNALPKSSPVYKLILKKRERTKKLERQAKLKRKAEIKKEKIKLLMKWVIGIGVVISILLIIALIWGQEGIKNTFITIGVIIFILLAGTASRR